MKFITLVVLISLFTSPAFSQGTNKIIGFYGGGGLATSNNYDVAISGGITYDKGLFSRTFLGVNIFYQGYALAFDNEAGSNKLGKGQAGVTVFNKSAYVFLAPQISIGIRETQNLKFYANAGIGYNMSGTETYRKWDYRYGSLPGNYDSTINTTANINKMLYRVGFGMEEYLSLGNRWFMCLKEDFGFIVNNLSTSGDVDNPNRTVYSPHSLNPGYISIQLGFSHTKYTR